MRKIFDLINKNLALIDLLNFAKTKPVAKSLPIITISREKGSGGRPIAYLVAAKLGRKWRVYHKNIIDQISQQAHLERSLVKEVDERRRSLIEELLGDFFGKRYPSLSTYYKHLTRILSTIAQRGCAVVVGRGAEYLIPHALKIRLVCQREQRIKWLTEFEKISRKEAEKRIDESDENRAGFIKTLYKQDIRQPHHYDLVIRTGPNLTIEDAAELIVKAAKRRFQI